MVIVDDNELYDIKTCNTRKFKILSGKLNVYNEPKNYYLQLATYAYWYEQKNGKLWNDPESVQDNELLNRLIEKSKSKDKPLVVKNSNNQIIGVITQADLLKAVIEGGDGE